MLRYCYGAKERPAAWVCVRASHAGQLVASGYADGQGRASLIFPYPVAPTPAVPLATLPPLQERAWPLQISVFSNHTLAKLATAPELCEVFKQPRATLSADGAPPALTAMAASLEYGRDLVLRTSGTSHLLIKPV